MSELRRVIVCLAGLQAYQLGILAGIRRALRTRPDWRIRIESSWAIKPEHVQQATVDGLIGEFYEPATLDAIVARQMPTVSLFGAPRQDAKRLSVLGCRDEEAGRMAARFVVEHGWRSFAVVGTDHAFSHLRAKGFTLELAKLGFSVSAQSQFFDPKVVRNHPLDIPGTLNRATLDWLRALPSRTAIFATADRIARGIAYACGQLRLSLPGDRGLIGVDDDPGYCESSPPEISSVAFPWEAMGVRACELLAELFLPRGKTRQETVLPTGVTARASTSEIAPDDAVARALAFIRDNLHRPIDPQDVVEHVRVAKRTLQRRFADHVGHGLREELQLQRVNAVKRLLETTDLPLDAIAKRVGMSGAGWLSRVFEREAGQSPTAYRAARQA